MGHDQRLKEFLHSFLQDFLKLFYPRLEERLDFGDGGVEFLDTELFTRLQDGARREADVVAKLRTRAGKPEIVLIHIEVQTRPERDVKARMFEYYSLLRSRYELPVFPIVVYLRRGTTPFAVEEHRETLFGNEILLFRFESMWLAQLNAEEYVDRGGPVAAALAALMGRRVRSRSRTLETLRVSMLWNVVESGLDEARQFILVDLIETYFPLSVKQNERYQQLVSRKEFRKVQDVELTWAEKLIERGREEGRESGVIDGKRKALLQQLASKFGRLPDVLTARINAVESVDKLDILLERVLTAASLDDMGL